MAIRPRVSGRQVYLARTAIKETNRMQEVLESAGSIGEAVANLEKQVQHHRRAIELVEKLRYIFLIAAQTGLNPKEIEGTRFEPPTVEESSRWPRWCRGREQGEVIRNRIRLRNGSQVCLVRPIFVVHPSIAVRVQELYGKKPVDDPSVSYGELLDMDKKLLEKHELEV